MKLQKLLDGINVTHITGDRNPIIQGVVSDHRKVKPGYAFVCYKGLNVDGHDFIAGAIQNGATAIVSEKIIPDLSENISVVVTSNGRKAQAVCAANWHGNPAKRLNLTGITGTNGKTSTAHLTDGILKEQGLKTAVLGTIGHSFDLQNAVDGNVKSVKIPAILTTPDPFELHAIFKQLVDSDVENVIMETSSQGLAQHRLYGLTFDTAVFTNLTQDHMDYHENMENYFSAKLMLFKQLSPKGLAILNFDSHVTPKIAEHIPDINVLTYGLTDEADLVAQDVEITLKHLAFTAYNKSNIKNEHHQHLTKIKATIQLLGTYNVYNALAAIGVGLNYNCSIDAIQKGLFSTVVPGRFENVRSNDIYSKDFAVIVDYAHTPDGLENVLTAARDISEGRLISVFGCGGDRDRSKRPKMGKISTQIADYSVITSDNPRTEDPDVIISDIISGLTNEADYVCVPDRKAAIQHAIMDANAGDVVVIAGKGHEDYQEIHGKRHPFDDRVIASKVLQQLAIDSHE